jgi:hypothetical protein
LLAPTAGRPPVSTVRQGTLCAVKRTGTGAPTSALSLLKVGRRRSAKASRAADAAPRPRKVDAQTASFGLNGAAVEAYAGAGVLRRHADDRGLLNAVGAHLADYVGNVGTPVAHADVDRTDWPVAFEFRFDQASLLDGDFSERAAANERVAVLNLLESRLLRERPAADHVAQVFGNLLDGLGRSVGEQEDGLL